MGGGGGGGGEWEEMILYSCRYRMSAPDALQHSWVRMLGGVGERVASPWLMAKLDISQLKSFITRRKWHVSIM